MRSTTCLLALAAVEGALAAPPNSFSLGSASATIWPATDTAAAPAPAPEATTSNIWLLGSGALSLWSSILAQHTSKKTTTTTHTPSNSFSLGSGSVTLITPTPYSSSSLPPPSSTTLTTVVSSAPTTSKEAPSTTVVSTVPPPLTTPASTTAASPPPSTASTPSSGSGDVSWAQASLVAATASGNGCPQGSVDLSKVQLETSPDAPNRQRVRFDLTQFEVDTESVYNKTKNCEFHLTIQHSASASFAGTAVRSLGYAKLAAGVTATFYETYYFSDTASTTADTQFSIAGGGTWAAQTEFDHTDTVPSGSAVYSTCGTTSSILNVNLRVALTQDSSDDAGTLTIKDTGLGYSTEIDVDWKAC